MFLNLRPQAIYVVSRTSQENANIIFIKPSIQRCFLKKKMKSLESTNKNLEILEVNFFISCWTALKIHLKMIASKPALWQKLTQYVRMLHWIHDILSPYEKKILVKLNNIFDCMCKLNQFLNENKMQIIA